jgi:hypothetical protein
MKIGKIQLSVSKKIKSDKDLTNFEIKYEQSSFGLNKEHLSINEETTMIDLKTKSSTDVLLLKYVSSFTERFNQMEKNITELKQSNQELKQSNQEFRQYTLFPLLIRQLRKEVREKIYRAIGLKSDDKTNCDHLKELIHSNNLKELKKKEILNWFSCSELKDLFLDRGYNYDLNCVAHPNLSKHKVDIYQLGELNIKMYNYLFQ